MARFIFPSSLPSIASVDPEQLDCNLEGSRCGACSAAKRKKTLS